MYQQKLEIKENRSFVKCSICKQEIVGKHRFIELAMNYGVICPECDCRFNNDEIELISNLFIAYGGYFGSKKGISKNSTHQIMKKLSNLHDLSSKNIEINALDVKILHQALLHGISPRQIVHGF
jgi:uncharacterized Zn-finger protein